MSDLKATSCTRDPASPSRNKSVTTSGKQALWNGILSWVSDDCPHCPLLYFYEDYDCQKSNDESLSTTTRSSHGSHTGGFERRKLSLERAQCLIQNYHTSEALDELLTLSKAASYKISVEECSLLMHTAEIVIRNQVNAARQAFSEETGHTVALTKSARGKTFSIHKLGNETESEEIIRLRELLMTLVDVSQMLRRQSDNEMYSLSDETSNSESGSDNHALIKPDDSVSSLVRKRFHIYTSLFGLLIQSAFIEAGLVSGCFPIDRLVSNAEQTYYLVDRCQEQQLQFLRPIATYIYGRLWCETSEDKCQAAIFLTTYYNKNKGEFLGKMKRVREGKNRELAHSPYYCNMRRIRQTAIQYQIGL